MDLTEKLRLVVDVDGARAVREMQRLGSSAEKELGRVETRAAKVGKVMSGLGVGMVGAGAVITGAMVSAATAFGAAEKEHLKLENTLKNMPKLAGETADAFDDQAKAIQNVTAADGDAVTGAQAMLGTFNLTKRQILDITPLVVDYSRKFGVDMVDAATQVGKALDGQVGALKRNGVSIDEAAYATDRFGAVQKALASQVGGFAEAEGATFAGQMERMKNQLGDIQEGVGKGAVEAFGKLLGPVQSASNWFTQLDESTQSAVGSVTSYGAMALIAVGSITTLTGHLLKARETMDKASQSNSTFVKGLAGNKGMIAAGLTGILAGFSLVKSVLDDARESASKMWADVDYSNLDGSKKRIDENKTSLEDFARSWNNMSVAEQAANYQSAKDHEAKSAQLQEEVEHYNEAARRINSLGQASGLGAQRASELVRALHIDPTQVADQQKLADVMRQMANEGLSAEDALKQLGLTEEQSKAATEGLKDEQEQTNKAFDDAKSAYSEAESALRDYFDRAQGGLLSEVALRDAQRSFAQGMLESQGALTGGTEAADKNLTAMAELAQKTLDYGLQQAKTTGDINTAKAAVNGQAEALANQLRMYGYNDVQIQSYLDKIGITPEKVNTAFNTPGLDTAVTNMQRLQAATDGFNAAMTRVASNPVARAAVQSAYDIAMRANTAAYGGGRASGGPTQAGMYYQVAEKGPEVYSEGGNTYLIPGGSGQVTPTGGGAGVVHAHINIDGREVASAIIDPAGHQRMVMT